MTLRFMKKLTLILLLAACFTSQSSFSEETSTTKASTTKKATSKKVIKKQEVKKPEVRQNVEEVMETKKPMAEKVKPQGEPDRIANIRFNALLLAGTIVAGAKPLIVLEADINIGKGFTVGPLFSTMGATRTTDLIFDSSSNGADVTIGGGSWGLRGNWYMSGEALKSGWYLGPFLNFGSIDMTGVQSSVNIAGSENFTQIGLLVGYHWFWDFGLNFNFGLGGSYYSLPATVTMTGTSGNVTQTRNETIPAITNFLPSIEMSLGFAF